MISCAVRIGDVVPTALRGQKSRTRWHIDEAYIKVNGKWVYLYRAIDGESGEVAGSIATGSLISFWRTFCR